MALKMMQYTVDRASEDSGYTFGITDSEGVIIACSDRKLNGKASDNAIALINSEDVILQTDGWTYRKVTIRNRTEYTVFVQGNGDSYNRSLAVLSAGIESIRLNVDEKMDRQSFMRSILMDNILPGDIILKARELRIQTDGHWCVILVKTSKPAGMNLMEVMQSIFPSRQKDFLVLVDDVSVVLIKDLKNKNEIDGMHQIGSMIADTASSELMTKVTVGVGSVVDSIRELARSYKEAQLAIVIGGIFESGKTVLNYNKLGIGRLVYQLPTRLCNLFLDEVFKGNDHYIFQSEILNCINKFLDCDFNVSEAAKQLYVHRNTLVYRLDKIQRDLGLDLRKFNDAIVIKFAIMVKKYLDSLGG